jgi:hypothetical protein
MRKLMMVGAAVLLAGAIGYAQDQNSGGPGTANTDCPWFFSSGAGASLMSWCVSSHGNLSHFQSPAGFEHIFSGTVLEGYVICSGTSVLAHDIGFAEFNFSPGVAVLAGPTASGITLRRFTADGAWQLDQKFSRDNKENDVSILMTLKRLGTGVADVRLARIFDPDVDNTFSVEEDRSDRGVWARVSRAVTLTNITYTQAVDTAYQSSFSAACSPASLAVPRFGDDAAVVTARLGVLGTGNNKKTTFVYRRQ